MTDTTEAMRAAVEAAMQDAWNDFCDDAGAYPDCFIRDGRKLMADFSIGNFALGVAINLQAALSTQQVPKGYKLVPSEPTEDMLQAGQVEIYLSEIYKAMLAAAPAADREVK